MKITLKWIQEFLPKEKNLSKERVVEALLGLGIEVEKTTPHPDEEYIFETALTPNLGHCMSVYGIARELSAVFQTPYLSPHTSRKKDFSTDLDLSIDIQSSPPPFFGVYAKVSFSRPPSSFTFLWEKRLHLCDLSPEAFFESVQEYSILSWGIPLHMLDAKKIQGLIRIAPAPQNMSIDGISIPRGALLILDQEKPLALAGICDFASAKPSDSDKEILLVSVYMSPENIRPTIKHSGVRSSSTKRMERGIDAPFMNKALSHTIDLLSSVDSDLKNTKINSFGSLPDKRKSITCRLKKINSILGINISIQEAHDYLERLGFSPTLKKEEQALTCLPPTYRYDILGEIDLIEEVGRLYGFNNIPEKKIVYAHSSKGDDKDFLFQEKVQHILLSLGMQEIISCDLISPEQTEILEGYTHSSQEELISVLHPSSHFQSILRPSLYAGLLSMAAFNQARQTQNMRVFEVGRVYKRQANRFLENLSCGLLLSGKRHREHYTTTADKYDFFDVKGIAEELFFSLGVFNVTFVPSTEKLLQPQQQAYIFHEKTCIGILGKVPPNILRKLQLQQEAFFAEIFLSTMKPLLTPFSTMEKLYSFPGIERDWTIPLPKTIPIGTLLQAFSGTHPLLQKISLQDIYIGKEVEIGHHNVTIRMTYRDRKKTLDHTTIKKAQEEVMQKVAKKLGLRVPLVDTRD